MYNTLSDVPFNVLFNLGQYPTIPERFLELQAVNIQKEHENRFKEFLTYEKRNKALNHY